jgi:hypothetical protein
VAPLTTSAVGMLPTMLVLSSAAQAALAEYNEVYGEPDEEVMAEARADLETIGLWKPETVHKRDARLGALARLLGEVPDQTHRRAG